MIFNSCFCQDGETPLHRASDEGSKQFVEMLLLNGADVTAQDNVSISQTPPMNHIFDRYDLLSYCMIRMV